MVEPPLPTPAIDRDVTGWEVYKRLLGYVRPHLPIFLLSIAGFIIYASTQAAFVRLMEYIVDIIGKGGEISRVAIPAALVGIFLVRGVGSFMGNYYIALVARSVVFQLRTEMFNHLMKLPSVYFDGNNSGYTISKVTYNVEQVTGAATDALKVIVREGFTVLILLGYLFYLNWRLSLVFLLVGPLIGGVVSYASKRFRRLSRRIQHSMGDVTHVASEAINGYRVVRTFGGEEYEKRRFSAAAESNLAQSMKMVLTSAISTPVIQLIVSFAMGLLVWLALHPDILADITPGQFIAFLTAAGMLAKPTRQLTEVNATIQKGIAASLSIFELLDSKQEEDKGTYAVDRVQGELEFRNVSFAYAEDSDPVLHDLSFKVAAGETVALVGRSGSGKTTLVSLLPRFYNNTEGEILLDGKPLQEYSLANLRKHIALVTQHVTLFNDTLAANMAYGEMAGVSEERIVAAATAAHAMEFIDKMPKGLQTLVGENGVLLSGGQRQRLAIARAILKDAPVLILDEATSALDTESERHIQSALEAVMEGRTTLVIAHRLSTIEAADRIMVLDQGRIVEAGRHEELLERDGHYAALHRMQFREEEAESGEPPAEEPGSS